MNAVRCAVLIAVIAANGCACTAQETPAQETSATFNLSADTHTRIYPASRSDTVPGTASIGAAAYGLRPPQKPFRVADSKFVVLNGIHLGMAVFDVEMTQRCIASHRCSEANPLLPSSQMAQLSVDVTIVALSSGISYWLKKRGSKLWWLPAVTGAAVHSAGVATGFEHQ